MHCHACAADVRAGAKFCEHCGARLDAACPSCGARVSASARFCGECGTPLGALAAEAGGRFASPQAYTPAHLAARILRERSARSGERKQVTVTASVIGREFALTLLRRVSELQDDLERSLGELERIELIYEKRGSSATRSRRTSRTRRCSTRSGAACTR